MFLVFVPYLIHAKETLDKHTHVKSSIYHPKLTLRRTCLRKPDRGLYAPHSPINQADKQTIRVGHS